MQWLRLQLCCGNYYDYECVDSVAVNRALPALATVCYITHSPALSVSMAVAMVTAASASCLSQRVGCSCDYGMRLCCAVATTVAATVASAVAPITTRAVATVAALCLLQRLCYCCDYGCGCAVATAVAATVALAEAPIAAGAVATFAAVLW